MFVTKTLAAGVIALSTLAAVPASATDVAVKIGYNGPGWSHHVGPGHQWQRARLSPNDIRHMLRRDGYRDIRFFDRRGAVYQVRASKRGSDFFLVVNARNGQILSRHRV